MATKLRGTPAGHADRVATSRLLPPPSVSDILAQTHRILLADLADGGVGWRLERGSTNRDLRLTLTDAVARALVDLRDGWLERPRADAERVEAVERLCAAAGVESDGRSEIALWFWSLEQSREAVLAVVGRALSALASEGRAVA